MRLKYLHPASEELRAAATFYEEAEFGLGARFLYEITKTEDRIKKFPTAWSLLSVQTRRCRTEVFPYGLIYQIRVDEILIVAVAHLKRKPMYWKDRVDNI